MTGAGRLPDRIGGDRPTVRRSERMFRGIEIGSLEAEEVIEDTMYERHDADFCDPRVDALKPSEHGLVMTMADCPYPPLTTSSVQNYSPKSAGNINVLMGRLVEEGIVFRGMKGVYELNAPPVP